MAKRKKDMKQKLAEFAYTKPSIDKKVVDLKKNLGEVSSMLNGKNKKKS